MILTSGTEQYLMTCTNKKYIFLLTTTLTISENAKRKASLESIIRIVNALGITVDELLAGVQLHNPTAYQTDLDLLMAECTENEKRFIYEMVKASIDSMHKNGWHISDDEA